MHPILPPEARRRHWHGRYPAGAATDPAAWRGALAPRPGFSEQLPKRKNLSLLRSLSSTECASSQRLTSPFGERLAVALCPRRPPTACSAVGSCSTMGSRSLSRGALGLGFAALCAASTNTFISTAARFGCASRERAT